MRERNKKMAKISRNYNSMKEEIIHDVCESFECPLIREFLQFQFSRANSAARKMSIVIYIFIHVLFVRVCQPSLILDREKTLSSTFVYIEHLRSLFFANVFFLTA